MALVTAADKAPSLTVDVFMEQTCRNSVWVISELENKLNRFCLVDHTIFSVCRTLASLPAQCGSLYDGMSSISNRHDATVTDT